MLLTILNVVFCLAFVVFAWLNLNDIDPWLWVPIYLSAAVCCGLAAFGLYYTYVYLALMAFYLVYAAILFFGNDGVYDWIVKHKRPSLVETMQADKPYIEKTREFFGLLIITGALLINYFAG
jgi:Transmembrane family 220, helix